MPLLPLLPEEDGELDRKGEDAFLDKVRFLGISPNDVPL